jgi:hypothetical protein
MKQLFMLYVFPVRYELGFISQKTAFFMVTAVKTSLHNFCVARRTLMRPEVEN